MKLHKKVAKLFGYELIRRKRHPSLESHLINLITKYKIDLVLDVGANHGQFGNKLRNEGYKGEIHSFEPVRNSFEKLQEICKKDKQWFAHQVAMGDVRCRESIYIPSSSKLSSFLELNVFGKERYKDTGVSDKESVEVLTIDWFLNEKIKDFAGRRIFLKIDTQGYDLKVFNGAINSLRQIVCLLSEISVVPIYEDMPHYLGVLKRYEEHGFAVTGFYPISRKEDMSIIEVDCTLINNKHIERTV